MQNQAPPPHINLNSLLARTQAQLDAINDYGGPIVHLDEEPQISGTLYQALLDANQLHTTTNFSNDALVNIYQNMQPFFVDARRRGPKPKSSAMDQLICYLAWGKLGCELSILSKVLDMKENRLDDNIDRIRPILNATLRYIWWAPRDRPRFQDDTPFPQVALLVDGHTSQVFRPKAPFDEAKIYWDAHNSIYGYKNEVAVMATDPHYCLFVHQKEVGSAHEYQSHKQHFTSYMDYLLKTPEEMHHLQGDLRHRFWAIMADCAYVGPAADTPDLRRVVPFKGRLTPAQRAHNNNIKTHRMPVEHFFGRTLQLWGVPRGIYRWDHATFQTDFENWCMLTNENIKVCVHLIKLDFAQLVIFIFCLFIFLHLGK